LAFIYKFSGLNIQNELKLTQRSLINCSVRQVTVLKNQIIRNILLNIMKFFDKDIEKRVKFENNKFKNKLFLKINYLLKKSKLLIILNLKISLCTNFSVIGL
jgi:hypothetical protein